ncbi:MAG: hypothetical protein ACI8SE_001487 [Bacteroidia bacterium]
MIRFRQSSFKSALYCAALMNHKVSIYKFKYMRSVLTILVSLISLSSTIAQSISYEIVNSVEVKDENGRTLPLGTAGGLNQPQFYNLDINNDDILDLFVFDRNGGKTISLIHDGNGNYTYEPKYDQIYPGRFTTWVVFKDYNADGKPDLWFFNEDTDAIALYKNSTKASDPHAMFEVRDADLRAYNFGEAPLDTNDLFCDRTNIPAIEDIDGDGDIDFMTLQTLGYGITLFLNNSAEYGKSLDSIDFEIADQCWGDFQEFDGSNEILFESDPFCFHKIYRHKKKHAGGSSILLIDNDGDTDMDAVIGNAGLNNLNLIINGKADLKLKIDSMVSNDSLFPSNSYRAVTDVFPAAYFQEATGDGVKDLIVAVNSFSKASYNFREANRILFYENKGKNDHPVFELKDSMFLDRDMVDDGGHTAPILADMDGDGDQDLILATNGDYGITKELADYLVYYENIGDKTTPVFQLKKTDYLGLQKDSIQRLSPCLGDLNRDGKPELLVGRLNGTLSLYSIIGSGSTATASKLSDKTYGIQLDQATTPNLADVDGDDYIDLVIGSYSGNSVYYRNTSKTDVPVFEKLQDTLGGILPGFWRLETWYNPDNNDFYDTLVFKNISYSAPVIKDLDGNGDPEFILGDERGKVTIYRDIRRGDITKFTLVEEDPFHLSGVNTCYDYNFGALAKPAFGDLNNDGKLDMVVGTERGGFHIALASGGCNVGIANHKVQKPLNIYPNPTTGAIQFEGINTRQARFILINIQGQTIYNQTINPNDVVDISFISEGIYVALLETESETRVAKLIKLN